MKNKFAMLALTGMLSGAVVLPDVAAAKDRDNYRNSRNYRGNDRYYRQRCGGGNGAVGTVAGGAGGAVLGSALGGGTLGTIAGGVGGALVGRSLDKQHTRSRRGC